MPWICKKSLFHNGKSLSGGDCWGDDTPPRHVIDMELVEWKEESVIQEPIKEEIIVQELEISHPLEVLEILPQNVEVEAKPTSTGEDNIASIIKAVEIETKAHKAKSKSKR